MGSKREYEQRKQARKNTKAIASLTTNPDELNVIINYCSEILIQKMLVITAEKRANMPENTRLRDERFDQIDGLAGISSPAAFRCEQTHILMNTIFSEFIEEKAPKDFTLVTELAVYLLVKLQPPEEFASARGYILTVADDFLDITCCPTDDDCVTGLNRISEKFAREGGYHVTIPPQSEAIDIRQEAIALMTISKNCKILTDDRPRVREIGERLHAAGGIEAMREVLMIVRKAFPYGDGREDGWHPAEIEAAWTGIGEWVR